MKWFKRYKGFSLSEVLLALAIVGIIAAMTIPNIINSSKQAEAETAVSTAYSHLGNALYASLREYQVSNLYGICSTGDTECFKNFMRTKLDYAQDCGKDVDECWFTFYRMDGGSVSPSGSAVILKNGMCVLFESINSNCNDSEDRCGRISVDINGPKGPNIYGKDAFVFHVWQNTLVPYGVSGDNDMCEEGKGTGFGCTAKYINKKR